MLVYIAKTAYLVAKVVAQKNPPKIRIAEFRGKILDISYKEGDIPKNYFFRDSSTATATETVIPTMGLLPAPRKPIISTWAGTEEEPAN